METGQLLIAVFFTLMGFFIFALLLRTIFKVDTVVRNLEYQTRLLMLLCQKHGVETDDIKRATGHKIKN